MQLHRGKAEQLVYWRKYAVLIKLVLEHVLELGNIFVTHF